MSDTQALLDSIAYVAWHRQVLRVKEPGRAVVGPPRPGALGNKIGTGHAGGL